MSVAIVPVDKGNGLRVALTAEEGSGAALTISPDAAIAFGSMLIQYAAVAKERAAAASKSPVPPAIILAH